VAETTVKRLLCCRFRRTGKAVEQVYQCWWRICQEMFSFYGFENHVFYDLYPFMTYLLTPPHTVGQIVADVLSGLSLTPPQECKKKVDGPQFLPGLF
jgi:hypothetical protein